MGRRMGFPKLKAWTGGGFLAHLARAKGANVVAIVAGSLVPLCGMIGGGLDLSRMYIVKTRLQHACDAGALAGRKSMGGGTWTQQSGMPGQMANRFFDANIRENTFGSANITRVYAESAGVVSGHATADVPMTLMKVLGKETAALDVTCKSEMRLPNTDVMFVLDTTGSMNEVLAGEVKIVGLRRAVRCFYEIVARLDTVAACDGDAPSGGTGGNVQVRFGFVPYATNANVGRVLPNNWIADEWTYQSRQISALWGVWSSYYDNTVTSPATAYSGYSNNGPPTKVADDAACLALVPADEFTRIAGVAGMSGRLETDTGFVANVQVTQRNFRRTFNSKSGMCQIQYRDRKAYRPSNMIRAAEGTADAVPTPAWTYRPVTFNLTALKNADWSDKKTSLPVGNSYTNTNVFWDGCVEERATVRATNYQPVPAGARDLDIDTAPTGNVETQWKPVLRNAVYARRENYSNSSAYSMANVTTFTNFSGQVYACPAAASKLRSWDATTFDNYVEGLTVGGNTYHDIGMLWGARLLSPTGLFRSENEFTSEGGEIERHLIFMTDGDTCTDPMNYQAYGIAWYDRRQTDPAVEPKSVNCAGALTDQVNARTAALCDAVKNMKNTTLWVIWFGTSNPSIEGRMRTCASEGRFFSARSSSQLQATFRSIANQISALRLTK